jgi:hypothetical protein
MTAHDKTQTHTAYAFSRQGKKFGKLLECGTGRIDRQTNLVHVLMDRGPIMGYTGYIVISPIGTPAPKVEPPTDDDENEDGDDEDES